MVDRIPLRIRVALAFAVTTAAALAGLSAFVYVRVDATLQSQLRDVLDGQIEVLAAADPTDRPVLVARMAGDTFGQIMDPSGAVLASSPQVRDHLVGNSVWPTSGASVEIDAPVVLHDEGAPEREAAMMLVRRDESGVQVVGISREDVDRALGELRRQLLIGVPVALLLAAGLGFLVAGSALRPIEMMRARAASISGHDQGERLPLPAAEDEVRRLGVTLNAMLDRLDEASSRQRRFVAEASHELRTPLALLRLELDLALAQPRSRTELTAAVTSASEEVERLSRLAQDLLTLAAIDEGGFELNRTRFGVAALLDDVAGRFGAMIAAAQGSIQVACDGDLVVDADRSRLDQVVVNLMDNALRHGGRNVGVSAQAVGGGVRIEVADDGPGFTEEFRDRAFDRFSSDDVRRGGVRGLGLSIVQSIVSEHGGSVSIGRSADGGASVVVVLPGPG